MYQIKHLNWDITGKVSVIILGLLLLGFSLHFLSAGVVSYFTPEPLSPQERFRTEYHLEELNIDASIHQKMDRTLKEIEADWVLFWGFHNGTEMGPFHINRISVIDEIAGKGKKFQLAGLQNVSTAQFSQSLQFFWKNPNQLRCGPTSKLSSFPNLRYAYENIGIYWACEQALTLKGLTSPIGLIGIYYGESKAKILAKDSLRTQKIKTHLKSLVNYVEYQLLKKQIYEP